MSKKGQIIVVYTSQKTYLAINFLAFEIATARFKRNSKGEPEIVQLNLSTENRESQFKGISCDGTWEDYVTCYIDRKDSIIDAVQVEFMASPYLRFVTRQVKRLQKIGDFNMERCFTQDQTQKHYQKLQPDILCLLSHFNPETQLKTLYLATYPSFENPNRDMIEDPEELIDPEEIFSSGFINLSLQMVSQFIKNFELEDKSRFGFHSMNIIARLSKETPEITSCAGTGSVILYQDHDSDVLGLLLSNRHSDNRFLNIQRQKVRELKELSLTILTYRYETLKNYDDCWTEGINLFREEIIKDRASAALSPGTQEYLQSKRYFLGCEVLSESTNLFDYLRLEKQFP